MPQDEAKPQLIINVLTEAQYRSIENPSDSELYLVKDESDTRRNIGELVFSTIPLTDAGLHLADGSLINGNGVYKDFYEYMLNGKENAIKFRGDLIDSNGVISGFTDYNCLQLNGPTARVDNSEYVVKFTTNDDLNTTQAIIASEHWICLDLGIIDGSLSTWNWETSSAVALNSVSANTTYWVKIVCSGTSRTFSISTDGTNYTQMITYTDNTLNDTTMLEDYDFVLGRYSHQSTNPFLGSIDLKESYIKRNNEFIWDGSNYTVLPKYMNTQANYNWFISSEGYGVCGQYVLDPTNKTIRLPKITGIIEGTLNLNKLGNVTDAGLPNITGKFETHTYDAFITQYDAFNIYKENTQRRTIDSSSSGNYYSTWNEFDASRSNSIYGNSNTVQPQTINYFYYIVIATLTKTDIEVDIDNITTDLNGKADKDLVNINYGAMRNALNSDDVPYVTGTYRNGYSWHRIWSDGFVEQGGRFKADSGTGYKDINLLVAMDDTNFDIYVTRGADSTTTTSYNVWAQEPAYTASTTMIRVYISNTAAIVYWRVVGKSRTS